MDDRILTKIELIKNNYLKNEQLNNILFFGKSKLNINYYFNLLINKLFPQKLKLNTINITDYLLISSKKYIVIHFYKKIKYNDISILKQYYKYDNLINQIKIFIIHNIHFLNDSIIKNILSYNNIILATSNFKNNLFYNLRIPNQHSISTDNEFYNNLDNLSHELYSKLTKKLVNFIYNCKDVNDYVIIKSLIYNIFKYNYDIQKILSYLCSELINNKNISDELRYKIIKEISKSSRLISTNEKKIIFIEEIIYNLASIYS